MRFQGHKLARMLPNVGDARLARVFSKCFNLSLFIQRSQEGELIYIDCNGWWTVIFYFNVFIKNMYLTFGSHYI